jgi:hypothetical protein
MLPKVQLLSGRRRRRRRRGGRSWRLRGVAAGLQLGFCRDVNALYFVLQVRFGTQKKCRFAIEISTFAGALHLVQNELQGAVYDSCNWGGVPDRAECQGRHGAK